MNGILNVYKNKGMSSFDVVRKIKFLAHEKKVGHTGTLDPEATGVLPVALGKATKTIDYIMNTLEDEIIDRRVTNGILHNEKAGLRIAGVLDFHNYLKKIQK